MRTALGAALAASGVACLVAGLVLDATPLAWPGLGFIAAAYLVFPPNPLRL